VLGHGRGLPGRARRAAWLGRVGDRGPGGRGARRGWRYGGARVVVRGSGTHRACGLWRRRLREAGGRMPGSVVGWTLLPLRRARSALCPAAGGCGRGVLRIRHPPIALVLRALPRLCPRRRPRFPSPVFVLLLHHGKLLVAAHVLGGRGVQCGNVVRPLFLLLPPLVAAGLGAAAGRKLADVPNVLLPDRGHLVRQALLLVCVQLLVVVLHAQQLRHRRLLTAHE
ncbi:MAG: hypothetical protein WCQ44_03165, partial [Opitutaceae bacterium]